MHRPARPARDAGERQPQLRGLRPLPADHRGRGASAAGRGSGTARRTRSCRPGMEHRRGARVPARRCTRRSQQATGTSPKGWLGPALTETFNTPALLARARLHVPPGLVQRRPALPAERAGDSSRSPTRWTSTTSPCSSGATSPATTTSAPSSTRSTSSSRTATEDNGRVHGAARSTRSSSTSRRATGTSPARCEEISARDEVWVTTSDAIADHYLATREDDMSDARAARPRAPRRAARAAHVREGLRGPRRLRRAPRRARRRPHPRLHRRALPARVEPRRARSRTRAGSSRPPAPPAPP